jgi:hypothetical protein
MSDILVGDVSQRSCTAETFTAITSGFTKRTQLPTSVPLSYITILGKKGENPAKTSRSNLEDQNIALVLFGSVPSSRSANNVQNSKGGHTLVTLPRTVTP